MNKKIVIALIGKARHGKDQSVEYATEYLNTLSIACAHTSFAKLLKDQAKMLGWDGNKDVPGRTFLQKFPTLVKEYFNAKAIENPEKYGAYGNNRFYAAKALETIKADKKSQVFFVSDMRFKQEYELFREDSEIIFVPVRVVRYTDASKKEFFKGNLTPEQLADISENDLNYIETDYLIENYQGLDELKKSVLSVMKDVLSKNKGDKK